MSVALFMDVHIRRAVVISLRLRSIDVPTAQEDGSAELDEDRLLGRATELGRVLVRKTTIYCAKAYACCGSTATSPE